MVSCMKMDWEGKQQNKSMGTYEKDVTQAQGGSSIPLIINTKIRAVWVGLLTIVESKIGVGGGVIYPWDI